MLVVGLAFAVLLIRRPESLATPEFYADDSFFYVAALRLGVLSLIAPYSGYLALIQHVAALPEAFVRPVDAPLVGYLAMTSITALVAGFLASDRMREVVPSGAGRVLLALLFVALPGTEGFFGSLANVQWVTAVFLVAMLVATPPTSRAGQLLDAFALLLASLTGPIGLLISPLFAWRALRDPRWRPAFVVVFGASVFQAGLLLGVAVRPYRGATTDLGLVPVIIAYRDLVVPIGGSHAIGAVGPSLPIAALVALALALAVGPLPRSWLLGSLYVALVVPLAGIWTTAHPTVQLLDPLIGERYFVLTGVIAGGLIAAALARRRALAIPIALLLVAGVLGDFRMAAYPLAGWSERAACIGGPAPCRVPVLPDPAFDVVWPGSN